MKYLKLIMIVLTVGIMMSLTACSDGGSGSASSDGSLSLALTDAATDDYQAVYVTIDEVQVCLDDENDEEDTSWSTVVAPAPQSTYNLLELVNGVQEQLGVTNLEAGHYTQMRLIIGKTPDSGSNILGNPHPCANYIVIDDDEIPLMTPSGTETGIKLVSGFDIYEGQITELILDFDAARSVVKAGNSGRWLLKPTIKVIGTTVATISGIITDGEDALEGVLVSAQFYDGDATVQATTVTDENGEYLLFVEPNTYNVVAYKEGYAPQCRYIVAESNSDYGEEDMVLTATLVGTLEGQVSVETEAEDASVSISIRQSIECEGGVGTTQIEIASLNVADGGNYDIDLPAPPAPAVESYFVVAETGGYDPQTYDPVDIADGETTTLDISFVAPAP